jgi:hypothetical protein
MDVPADPRMLLFDDLISCGIERIQASSISLDAGSSQTSIDIEYLEDIKVPFELREIVLNHINKFYRGGYYEYNRH